MTADSPPSAAASVRFSPELKRVIVVTTLGSVLAFLDSTIVNIALRTLSSKMHTSLSAIQWLATAYLLAMAAVIPVSGWVANRFGAKQVYIAAVVVFTAASLACGFANSAGQLTAFRAVQGAAGGLAIPIGQMITVQTSGPRLVAKVMSVAGIPVVLAPIFGPTIGGLLLQDADWRWIFFINVPIGLLVAVLAVRLLPAADRIKAKIPDFLGMVLITAGSVAVTYGLAEIGSTGHVTSAKVVVSVLIGVVLLIAFVLRSLTAASPLVDVRLYASRLYSAASVANFCVGAASLGAIIVMPLYFQIVRHQGTIATGLLLAPQGVGVALAMWKVSKLVERLGAGVTAFIGGFVSVVATVPFLFIGDHTSYWLLGAAMLVRGYGVGTTAIPAISAAYKNIQPQKIPDATIQLNIGQRIGGSVGTAILAVALQNQLAHAATSSAQADAFGVAFWWVLAIALGATIPAIFLAAAERRGGTAAPAAAPPVPSAANAAKAASSPVNGAAPASAAEEPERA